MEIAAISIAENKRLFNIAASLAVFTIVYNLGEGIISTWLGYEDESLALFGFVLYIIEFVLFILILLFRPSGLVKPKSFEEKV